MCKHLDYDLFLCFLLTNTSEMGEWKSGLVQSVQCTGYDLVIAVMTCIYLAQDSFMSPIFTFSWTSNGHFSVNRS